MIKKTPPQHTPPQQQQQQPAQRQKRKKTVQAITLADPSAATVLEALCNSEASTFTDAEENFPVAPVDERTVGLSVRTNKLNSKVTAWDIDSEELDLQKWTLAQSKKRSAKERIEKPKTYASSLKGSSTPGPNAKPLEQARFVKRNTVKR